MDDKIKHTSKDSVFACLFQDMENALKLYLALHPEDKDVTPEDCELFNLRSVLVAGIYNDFGMLVRDKIIILLEVQSTFARNIALRILLYLAETYDEYVKKHKLDLYSTTDVEIPRPELYMAYVGSRKNVPDKIRLSELYKGKVGKDYGEKHGWADLEVKVIRGTGKRDILDQYIRFCEIMNEMRQKYGNTLEAVKTIIEKCLEEGILVDFLTSRREEVQTIMTNLFDDETIMRNHDYQIEQKAEQAGIAKGIEQGIRAMVEALQAVSQSRDAVIQTVADKFGLQTQVAADKVAQYWG